MKPRDLWRAAVTQWKDDRADAPADVDLGRPETRPADFETKLLGRTAVDRAENRKVDLASMGVAGKNQAHARTGCPSDDARMMREQNCRCGLRDTTQCTR